MPRKIGIAEEMAERGDGREGIKKGDYERGTR